MRPKPDAERELTSDQPIDPLRTLRMHRMGRRDSSVQIEGDELLLASRTPEGPVAIAFRSLDEHRVLVRAWGPGADHAAQHAGRVLGLHDDPSGFDPAGDGTAPKLAARKLKRFVKEQEGLRLGQCYSLFDVTVRTVLQQRVTWIEATGAQRYLTSRYGEPSPLPEVRLPIAPKRLAQLPYYDLHPAGIERSRARTLQQLARHADAIDGYAELPLYDAKAALFALPGIGGWSVGMIAGFGLGDPDAVPVFDYHLPNVVCSFVAGEQRGDDARMLELLKPWKGQRFRVVRLLYDAGVHAERRGPKLAPSRWTRDPRH